MGGTPDATNETRLWRRGQLNVLSMVRQLLSDTHTTLSRSCSGETLICRNLALSRKVGGGAKLRQKRAASSVLAVMGD